MAMFVYNEFKSYIYFTDKKIPKQYIHNYTV